MTVNEILEFIKSFIGWQQGKPFNFKILFEREYREGLLLRVTRESITNKANLYQVGTFVFIARNKSKPYLYVFLDSLEPLAIRNLTHRVQIICSERYTQGDTVNAEILLSDSYYLKDNALASSVVTRLILYASNQDYFTCDWNWEIESLRKQSLMAEYTDYSQSKARETYRTKLDRFEIRVSAPKELDPILLETIAETMSPKKESPKSRIIEILLIGGFFIALTLILVSQ